MSTSAQDLMNTVATAGYAKLSPLDVERCILAAIGSGGGGSNNDSQGNGDPVLPPSDTSLTAYYTDLDNGVIWSWSIPSQAWI